MQSRKSMLALLVGVLGTTICIPVAECQEEEFEFRGIRSSFAALPAEIADGNIWAGDCAVAYDTVYGDPRSEPARKRYAAALELEACIKDLEASVASRSRDIGGSRAADLGIRTATSSVEDKQREFSAQMSFLGMSFGVGVGVSFSEEDVVSEAEIGSNGTIVATKTENQLPRVVLESHYYGWCRSGKCNAGRFGVGPYFAIVAKTEKLLSAFSAGVMFGWKDQKQESSGGFSIGVGALLDADVKSLASGFEVGEPPPGGETAIRYETSSRWSGVIFFTRTF
jgi:hypothetical protein